MPMRLNETTRVYFDKLATISPPDKAARYRALLAPAPPASVAQRRLGLGTPPFGPPTELIKDGAAKGERDRPNGLPWQIMPKRCASHLRRCRRRSR